MTQPQMPTLADIAAAIEEFAPRSLQESYDNAGIQVGDPRMPVSAALICLDVTERVVDEAARRGCNLILSHHPVLFRGLKRISGATPTERIVAEAIRRDIAIYSAHTNLDSAWQGVSYEIARALGVRGARPLQPAPGGEGVGLGIIGELEKPLPALEFLRLVRETFGVKALRFSGEARQLVVRRVAACGGSGASLIGAAIEGGADAYISGDIKYHDFTTYGSDILLADIGHYESEICTKEILARIIREKFPNFVSYFAHDDRNPVRYLIG